MPAPVSTLSGACAPPMASSAMTMRLFKPLIPAARVPLRVLGSGGLHFAPIILPARGTDMVRALELAAIRAFGINRRLQRVVRATHVAARRRGFSFRNGHGESQKKAPPAGAYGEV